MTVALFSAVSQTAAAVCEKRVLLISPNSKLFGSVSIGANLAITSLTFVPSIENTTLASETSKTSEWCNLKESLRRFNLLSTSALAQK